MFDEDVLNRLYRYCTALCREQADAYDLLQTGVERSLRNPPADPERLFAYTIKIIRNTYFDLWRREQSVRFEPLDAAIETVELDIANLERVMVDRDELEHVWRRMTGIEREILFLWAVEGYTTEEVAAHLERPRGSVLSIIHRMRRRLASEDGQRQEGS